MCTCTYRYIGQIINKEEGYETSPRFLWEQYRKTPVLGISKGLIFSTRLRRQINGLKRL